MTTTKQTEMQTAGSLNQYAHHVSRPYVDFLRRCGMDFDPCYAKGAVIEDRSGRKYIDCIGGYGSLNVGHNHPRVVEALIRALENNRPFGWPFIPETHAQLIEKLTDLAPGEIDRCLIVNSGSEAVDSVLKFVRLATGKSGIICCEGAWHGFTMGALSVSTPEMCKSFGALLSGVRRVPYGDVQAASDAISPEVGAIIIEPIQAEGGVIFPPEGYLKDLSAICAASGILLIVDEIKTGMGKTGTMFACEFEHAEPDVVLVGKSLGGGVMPIGALLAKRKWWSRFGLSFAMTSSSSGGNGFASAAGIATLNVIQSENLCENAERQGKRLLRNLIDLPSLHPEVVQSVSGRGLLVGLHITNQKLAFEVIAQCAQRGVLLMSAFLDRTRILIEPPLCITDAQVDEISGVLRQIFDKVHM